MELLLVWKKDPRERLALVRDEIGRKQERAMLLSTPFQKFANVS
jgi:hypothetical protein